MKLLFFIVIFEFILYYIVPQNKRWLAILCGNFGMYLIWDPKMIFVLIFVIVISYLGGILINSIGRIRQIIIFLLIALPFFIYKYLGFVLSLIPIINIQDPISERISNLIVPLGISFYTMTAVGYLFDIYRGKLAAERHFGKYAAFLSFFPTLISGPIMRADKILPQLNSDSNEQSWKSFNAQSAYKGLWLIIIGCFKKFVVADTLARGVELIYDNLYNCSGLILIICSVLFSIQIYADFSGYSDIAIGIADLFGIDLGENFNTPYMADNIQDFWRRWHISLSNWFRDYVYIPMGGNRVSKSRNVLNLMVTFIFSGLWHGANWTFIIWGVLHGLGSVIDNHLIRPLRNRKGKKSFSVLFWFITMAFINAAWIFFRADSLKDAVYIISNCFNGINDPINYIKEGKNYFYMSRTGNMICLFDVILLIIIDFLKYKNISNISNTKINGRLNWVISIVMVLIVIFLSVKGNSIGFIYQGF